MEPSAAREHDDPATRGLTSTGVLASGPDRGTTPRRALLAVLACVALLAGGTALRHQAGAEQRTRSSAAGAAAGDRPGELRVSAIGPAGLEVRSDTGSVRMVVTDARRVPSGAGRSTLELSLHIEVRSGFQTLAPESFAVSDLGGATRFRAGGLTLLRPGPQILPSAGGFQIPAPASVDAVVLLDVPPADYVVWVLGGPENRPLATFRVAG